MLGNRPARCLMVQFGVGRRPRCPPSCGEERNDCRAQSVLRYEGVVQRMMKKGRLFFFGFRGSWTKRWNLDRWCPITHCSCQQLRVPPPRPPFQMHSMRRTEGNRCSRSMHGKGEREREGQGVQVIGYPKGRLAILILVRPQLHHRQLLKDRSTPPPHSASPFRPPESCDIHRHLRQQHLPHHWGIREILPHPI